jgi:uncharacterized protein (TIGR00251 family)
LSAGRAELSVRLQPGASRSEIAGERDGAVLVRVTAPPIEGPATEALRKLIAKRLGVAKGRVTIAHGQRARDKVVWIDGVEEGEVRTALARQG